MFSWAMRIGVRIGVTKSLGKPRSASAKYLNLPDVCSWETWSCNGFGIGKSVAPPTFVCGHHIAHICTVCTLGLASVIP